MRRRWTMKLDRPIRALAADGDGTLLRGDHMSRATAAALQRWRRSGRKVLLTTGERSKEVREFPHVNLFDLVIAENGALLFDPATRKEHVLASPPPTELLRALRQAKVEPIQRGRVILATENSQEAAVSRVLADLHVGWQMLRNRRNLMILPEGINKASGLTAALKKLRLVPGEVIGVGDAENDIRLLEKCGIGAAVANAVPPLKKKARVVAKHGYGRGVVDLIDRCLEKSS